MRYVQVPKEITSRELKASDFCLSPGRYVRFIPPQQRSSTDFVPLDQLVRVREDVVPVRKGDIYRYAEIGDIDVNTGGIQFHPLRGYQLPMQRPAIARRGDVLISTVRTYRKGIGCVMEDGDDLVTTNAVLNLCGVTDEIPYLSLPYVYAFLRTDLFIEQVWALLNRGVYPRLDTGAMHQIMLPVSRDARVVAYVASLAIAIAEREQAIRTRHEAGLLAIGAELDAEFTERFRYRFPTSQEMLEASRMDAGFWSPALREKIYKLQHYRRGAWASIYDAGFTTRRGPNLAVSVAGEARYSDEPFGAALPLATPGDLSDYMTIPRFRYYGNRRRVDTVRHGEVIFAAKGVREVSIGHTWVNLGDTPFVTNFDSFLIHSTDRTRAIFLAYFLSYLKSVGVFARLSDTSNGGSFVQSHFHALPIPKFDDDFVEKVARFYHSPTPPPGRPQTLEHLVTWHREWNKKLGIWELDRELKALQSTLAMVQEQIILGKPVKVPFS